jgi:hypothetical protein
MHFYRIGFRTGFCLGKGQRRRSATAPLVWRMSVTGFAADDVDPFIGVREASPNLGAVGPHAISLTIRVFRHIGARPYAMDRIAGGLGGSRNIACAQGDGGKYR